MKKSEYMEKYLGSKNAGYLHAKRMEVYQKYGLEKYKNPDFDMSILDYMKENYPDEDELIALEEIRVQDNQKIFDEWQMSGDTRSFRQYAHDEYAFDDIDDLTDTVEGPKL